MSVPEKSPSNPTTQAVPGNCQLMPTWPPPTTPLARRFVSKGSKKRFLILISISSASNLLSVQPPPIWAPIYGPVQVQTGAGGGGGALTGRSAAIADVASAVSPSVVSPSATPKVRIIAPLRTNELGFGLRRIHLAESLVTPIALGQYRAEVRKYW